jgi:hypothetical protein
MIKYGTTSWTFTKRESDADLVCDKLLDLCLRQGSKGNMTTILTNTGNVAIGAGSGVMRRRAERETDQASKGTCFWFVKGTATP